MATEHDSQTPANARDRHITDEDALRYHSDEPPGKLETNYPFSDLIGKKTNTLIFPNLSSGNIAYKLIQEIGGVSAV